MGYEALKSALKILEVMKFTSYETKASFFLKSETVIQKLYL